MAKENEFQRKLRKLFKCAICESAFDSAEQLDIHIHRLHYCSSCGEAFQDVRLHSCNSDNDSESEVQTGKGREIEIPRDSSHQFVFSQGTSSFQNLIASFSHDYSHQEIVDVIEGIDQIQEPLFNLVSQFIDMHKAIRLKLGIQVLMFSPKSNEILKKFYNTNPKRIVHKNFLPEAVSFLAKYLSNTLNLLSNEISGLIIRKLLRLDISILKFSPLLSEGFLPLSQHLSSRKALLNIKTTTGKCLAYSVAAALHHKAIFHNGCNIDTAKGRNRQKLMKKLRNEDTFTEYVDQMKYTDVWYGENLCNLDLFEDSNDVTVSIIQYCSRLDQIVPVRLTKKYKKNHAFILMILREHLDEPLQAKYSADLHYVAVLDIATFMSARKKKFVTMCRYCFTYIRSPEHEKLCFENDLIGIKLPSTRNFKFNDHYKLTVPPTFFVYSLLFQGTPENIKIGGFCLYAFTCDFEIIFSRTYVGTKALDYFFNELITNARYYAKKNDDKALHIQLRPTAWSLQEVKTIKTCYICGEEATKENPLTQNHSHHSTLVNGIKVNGKIKGEAYSFPCKKCNFLITPKKRIPVYGYNISQHAKYFLRHVSKEGVKSISITPFRSSDSIGSILINKDIQIIDMQNHFNDRNLHDIMKTVDSSDLHLLKKYSSSDHEFSILKHGLPFPNFCETFPNFATFHDIRYTNNFLKSDYDKAHTAYQYFNCQNLGQYGQYCLETDTLSLASLIVNYAIWAMQTFNGICPMFDISIGTFSYSAMHYVSQSNYTNLLNGKILKTVESTLLPGISLSNQRHQVFKSKRLGDDDVTEEESIDCLYADVKSQFTSILLGPLPCDEYRYWTKHEILHFNIYETNENDDINYMVQCSLSYPDYIHDDTNSLPLGYCRAPVESPSTSCFDAEMQVLDERDVINTKIDLSLHAKEKVWMSARNLKLFLSLGMELACISGIISYKVSNHLAPFAKKCIQARQCAKNEFYAHFAKCIPNVAVGKLMQKRQSIKVSLPTTRATAERLFAKSNFVDASAISEDLAIVYMRRKKSMVSRNSLIAWHVLQASSYQTYEFYYKHLKGIWGNRVSLLYAQTDSILASIRGSSDIFCDLAPIKDIFDLSSLPESHALYNANDKSSVGKWKFEATKIREFLSLRQKSFSILETGTGCWHHHNESCNNCSRTKGVRLRNVAHSHYRDILNKRHSGVLSYRSVKHDREGRLIIEDKSRLFLSLSDGTNRIWVRDNESLAKGHYMLRS